MKALYLRCSTEGQDFDQQMQCIKNYLNRINEKDELLQVVEKVSGSVRHTERKLDGLLKSLEKGSTIYISELSRLGRNMADLFNIISEASEREITIIQCKDGTPIENRSIGGKALLFALSLAAEIELENIRQRTRMGLAARKAKGLPTGGSCRKELPNMDKPTEASAESRKERARNNKSNLSFRYFIEDWQKIFGKITEATDFKAISDEMNKRGLLTPSGLEYNPNRTRAMFAKVKRLYSMN